MNRRSALLTCLAPSLYSQDMIGIITGGKQPVIAIPDFRGAGEAQPWMQVFNVALYDEIAGAGLFKICLLYTSPSPRD